VVTFAYDWRHQLGETASLFDSKVRELLNYKQPIKIIGHSMGGVLVRDFILRHDDTWQRLNKSNGFSTAFPGAPLGGSYRIPYVLFGKDPIIGKLSKIDIVQYKKGPAEDIFCFPGLVEPFAFSKRW
jgi:pimeloyl-ACP methyl ester carboxylesterase